jgi:hypothetical protein
VDDEILWLLLALLLLGGGKAAVSVATPTPSGPSPTPATGPVHQGDLLIPGASYRASITLTGLEAAFGTSEAVKAKLVDTGFKNVQVTDHGGGSFEATGQWGGAAVPAKFPEQVTSVVRT